MIKELNNLKKRREFIKANAGKVSVQDMADEFGCSKSAIYFEARKMKISLELDKDLERRKRADAFIKANCNKMSFAQIARELNEPNTFIWNRARKMKLDSVRVIGWENNGFFVPEEYAKVATL